MKKTLAKALGVASVSLLSLSMMGIGMAPAFAAQGAPLTIEAQESPSWVDNFNPLVVGNLQSPTGVIYESLFYFSTTGQKYPLLGTSYSWNGNDTVLTVQIRKGVKWSDGKPFTAQDVAFTYNLLKKYPAADLNGVWKQIKSVKAVGNSVVFTFTTVNTPFYQILIGQVPILPQHIWSSVGDPTKFADANPVGTGPYTLMNFSTQDYKLKANPHYWGGMPPVPVLNYPALASNTSADLLLSSGKLDWAGLFVTNIKNIYVAKDPAHNQYWFPAVGDVSVFPNLKNPLLSNLTVRKAMSLAINRQQIQNIGEYGYEAPASTVGLVLPQYKAWLNPAAGATNFAYNVNLANAMLDKAGFKKGPDGIRAKGGQKLEFNLIAPAGWTDWNEDQSLVAADLQQIGIKVNVQQVQQSSWQNQLSNHTFQLAIETAYDNFSGNMPFSGFNNSLLSTSIQNYEGVKNAAIDSALNAFQHTSNKAIQKKAMYKIESFVQTQLPVIPLVYAANWYEFNTKHYTGWPSASNPIVDAPPYNAFSTGIVLMHLKPVK